MAPLRHNGLISFREADKISTLETRRAEHYRRKQQKKDKPIISRLQYTQQRHYSLLSHEIERRNKEQRRGGPDPENNFEAVDWDFPDEHPGLADYDDEAMARQLLGGGEAKSEPVTFDEFIDNKTKRTGEAEMRRLNTASAITMVIPKLGKIYALRKMTDCLCDQHRKRDRTVVCIELTGN